MASIIGYSKCMTERNGKTISLKDKDGGDSRYIANNPKGKMIAEFQVDGCIINDTNREKCDYMLLDYEDKKCYFIELKGSDVGKAYSQLAETIKFFKSQKEFNINIISGKYIVLTRVVLSKGNVPNIRPRSLDKLSALLKDINREKAKDGLHIKRIKSGQVEEI